MKHPGMLITTAILQKRGVCTGWRLKFRRKYPNARVRITQDLCEKKAQIWPWEQMSEKLLNQAGRFEFNRVKDTMSNMRVESRAYWEDNPISTRARRMALASAFGFLAQQKKYDPAYTP